MTLSHALGTIKGYKKRYGVVKSLRATIHYAYMKFRKLQVDIMKEKIISIHGTKMITMANDQFGTSSELAIFSSHEPVTTKLISSYLKKDFTCLDVGGNIGYYALLEKQIIGNKGKIIAIEPSPLNFEYLKKNLGVSENSENILLFNIAAGERDGQVEFLMYEEAGNSSMIVPKGMESKYHGTTIDIPIKKIDTLLEEISLEQLDFIRMDAEGYEYNIFEGMKKTLEKFKPIVQLEFHRRIMGDEKACKFLEGMKELGYEAKYFLPRDLDVPFIGTLKDVQKISLDEILQKLKNKSLSTLFMITLVPKEKMLDFKIN